MDIKEELTRLPKSWGYVAVNGNKQPYQKDWQNKPLSRLDLFKELSSGKAKAIGVVSGPKSGVMFLDHDGASCTQWLTENNLSIGSLPHSWMVTSGRVGRFQLIYKVPEKYWPKIKTKKYKTGKKDSQGNIEQVELRWEACQSIVAGEHPMEGCGYRWMEGRSPSDLPLADAPESLLKMMMEQPAKKAPVEILVLDSDADKARSLLQSINPSRLDDYDTWVKIGMAAHSVGDDSLLSDWENLSSKNSKYEEGECKKKWDSFKRTGISLGSLQRFAKEDGWTPPPRSFPATLATTPEEATTPIPRKLEQLTSQELIEFLRNQEQSIRFNTFTHSIEIDGKLLKNVDLFYLQLAQKGFKVTKELAIDCLLLVAHENEFDPVKNYLEYVSQNVEPTYIEMLATTYLRPCDADIGEPTIYDAMLKATLINAVRRVYEPGAKHDYACVLMGGQGIRKSSFWKTLGGSFFADGIGDLASKDALLALHRSWICEIDELDHVTSKKHAGLLKSFLSRSTDLLRVPYGRAVEEYPRRGILVGSTNRDDFLLDDTGNRRFWCIPVDRSLEKPIDLDSLQLERDAIFSAAVKAYKNREPHYLSTQQENQIQLENMNYLVQSPWRPPIEAWLSSPANAGKPITTEILLTEAIEKPVDKQNRSDQMQVSTVLKTIGYSKKRKSIDGVLKYVYFPTSESG
jgi:predicted P-loop ATPase